LEYSNPQIPEGINTSREHPLKEFALLLGGLLGMVVVAVFVLTLLAEWLAEYVPFSSEKELAALYPLKAEPMTAVQRQAHENIRVYLQGLANQLQQAEHLPTEMTISVHYVNQNTLNAFATLGGHVVFFRGLLEKIPDENTLAMVMAHEMAHIKHRHPIRNLGRGVVVAAALAVVSASVGDNLAAGVMQDAGLLTVMRFSRSQESEADTEALAALQLHYGHVGGSRRLFQILAKARQAESTPPAFFSTHPLGSDRIVAMKAQAQRQGWKFGPSRPLPAEFAQWLADSGTAAENAENVN